VSRPEGLIELPNGDRRISLSVPLDPKTGCATWPNSITNMGYGQLYDPKCKRPVLAHRFYYEALVGPIAEGMVIDHLCRNRACVNPQHMEVVTQAENVRRGTSPLTVEDVREIRAAKVGYGDLRPMAEHYGISYDHIKHIRSRQSWKDVA
jgi:hypothetical protein